MLDNIARGNQTTAEGILESITSQGVNSETLLSQIKSELLWNKIVRGRFGSYINISDEEVNIIYDRTIQNINNSQYDISEIFIGFEDESEEKEAKELTERLTEQLKNEIAFEPVAQQFSQAPSSGQGGFIGWVSEGQLDPDIISNIKNLEISEKEIVKIDSDSDSNDNSLIKLYDQKRKIFCCYSSYWR